MPPSLLTDCHSIFHVSRALLSRDFLRLTYFQHHARLPSAIIFAAVMLPCLLDDARARYSALLLHRIHEAVFLHR